MHSQTQKEIATNCGSLVALSRLPRPRRGQYLTLDYTSQTTLEPYARRESSKQALNSAETNSTLLFFFIFIIFSFFKAFLLYFNFFLFIPFFSFCFLFISLVYPYCAYSIFSLLLSFFYFCYSLSFFTPFSHFPLSLHYLLSSCSPLIIIFLSFGFLLFFFSFFSFLYYSIPLFPFIVLCSFDIDFAAVVGGRVSCFGFVLCFVLPCFVSTCTTACNNMVVVEPLSHPTVGEFPSTGQ